MFRSVFSFLSMLSFGILGAAAIVALVPWLSGQSPEGVRAVAGSLHFESVLLGVVIGLGTAALARFNWADMPRRLINWVLIRERQIYGAIALAAGLAILFLY